MLHMEALSRAGLSKENAVLNRDDDVVMQVVHENL